MALVERLFGDLRTAVDLEVGVAAGPCGGRERASRQGARPRFVWSTTPVALITGVMRVAMRDARVMAEEVTMSVGDGGRVARRPHVARTAPSFLR